MGFFSRRSKAKTVEPEPVHTYADKLAIAVLNAACAQKGTDPMNIPDLDTPHGPIKNVMLYGLSKMKVYCGTQQWMENKNIHLRFKIVDPSQAYISAKYQLWFGEGDMKVFLRDLFLTMEVKIDHQTKAVKVLSLKVDNLGKMKVQLKGMAKLFTGQFEKQLEQFRPYVIEVFRDSATEILNSKTWTVEIPLPRPK